MSDAARFRRGDVVIAEFPEAVGSEIKKRRPWVVLSPDELNAAGSTFLIAPLTTGHHPFVYRVPCKFAGRAGHVVLDQLRTAASIRLRGTVGSVSPAALHAVLGRLRQMFEE